MRSNINNKRASSQRLSQEESGKLPSADASVAPAQSTPDARAADAGTIPQGFQYRNQKKRYPWWVKSVDRMTTETDDSVAVHPRRNLMVAGFLKEQERHQELAGKGRARLTENIKNNVPGWQLKDVALLFASGTYFAGGATLDGKYYDGIERIAEIVSVQIHPPDELGVPRWEGSEEEASEMVQAAAIHLGAAQVGYAAVKPLWLHPRFPFRPKRRPSHPN